MVLPLHVDDLQHDVALDPAQQLGVDQLLLVRVAFSMRAHNWSCTSSIDRPASNDAMAYHPVEREQLRQLALERLSPSSGSTCSP